MCLARIWPAAAIGCVAAAALLSCSDGTAPVPTVSLTSDETIVALGQRVTLTWTSRHASGCTAEGAWSGSKAVNGSESVPVPLDQTRNAFALVCSRGGKAARTEVVVTIRPPRFSVLALPLRHAFHLNDAGEVLGYKNHYDDPAVWTATGVLDVDVSGPWCPPGGPSEPWWVTAIALNDARTVLVRVSWGPGLETSCLVALGGQSLPGGALPIDDPRAVNDSVQVVGSGYTGTQLGVPAPRDEAVLLSSGQATIVQPPGTSGMATVINEAGVVAGYYRLAAGGPVHLFRYENGVSTDLGTSASGGLPIPNAINAAGTVVGELAMPEGSARESLAFRVCGNGCALEALPNLGGVWNIATGINDLEQVVGSSTLPAEQDTHRATLLSAGTLYVLDDLVVPAQDVSLDFGMDINNSGQVLAVDCDAAGENCRPYLLTPVEPR